MGNSMGGKKMAKVMKINGETMKFKVPITAGEVSKDYPGHVVMDSECVKHFGIRAKPLDPNRNLDRKRLYFLVEMPRPPHNRNVSAAPRRVRSGINMSAKDRLESLMLSRRSTSDLSIMRPTTTGPEEGVPVRVRMKLPKVEVERLVRESRDDEEAAERIMALCSQSGKPGGAISKGKEVAIVDQDAGRTTVRDGYKKRVGFLPINEGEIAVAS